MTSSTSSSGASNGAAMALYDKYSALHRGIEEARQQIDQCQQAQDDMRAKIQRAREERDEMEASTEVAKRETQDLHRRAQEALRQHDVSERERQALMDGTSTRRNYQMTKQYVQDQHQVYLEGSRDFRSKCKRLRVMASAVGEPMAPSHAFLALHADTLTTEELDFLAHPTGQDEEERDEELTLAILEYERCKKKWDDARTDIQRARKLDQESRDRAMHRRRKKEQLNAQLRRLRSDVTDVRLELSNIENETRQTMELAQTYQRDATHRRRNRTSTTRSSATMQVTPSPYTSSPGTSASTGAVRNPYARPSTSSHANGPTPATAQAPPLVPPPADPGDSYRNDRDSLDRRQQPHRIGRMRSNREFSTALDIIGGEEYDGDFEFDGIAETESPVLSTVPSLSNPAASTLSAPATYKTIGATRSTLVDSDEEDENDFLSYVAFSDMK